MRSDLIVKFFQNPSRPWLPTGVPKVEIWQFFVFFWKSGDFRLFKKKGNPLMMDMPPLPPPTFQTTYLFSFPFWRIFALWRPKKFRKFLF
jgi:hypothetical protein